MADSSARSADEPQAGANHGREAPWSGRMGWRERWARFRNRLISDPAFQRRAAAFPLTRPIADRNARALFDLCAGFVYTQVLHACVELDLFRHLEAAPLTCREVAARTGLTEGATLRLLSAAASLGLVERHAGDRYGLGALGAVVAATPAITAMIAHHALLYRDLQDPVALLKGDRAATTELGAFWPYAGRADGDERDPARAAAYSRLMAETQPLISADILDAYPVARHKTLLDVGGGTGAFLSAVAARAPGLALTLFDLPPVAAAAKAHLASVGLGDRVAVEAGDFRVDPLPRGADVVSLVRVLFDHDDATALAILSAVRRALPPGGVLLVAEPMAGVRGAEPIGDAYFGFYLLAMGRGRPRRPEEHIGLIREAGFKRARLSPTARPIFTSLIVADA